ncbi:MAG: cyclopropane-fatty-acyl-phospholipid synthase family protein [Hyphomicrobiales bacterium]|nr:cyclopropane-fatty-acyl-phospholipid synthase family protein [Hyphomicrobiales bacterium]
MKPMVYLLGKIVNFGTLTVIDPAGASHVFGTGSTPFVTVRIHDNATLRHLILHTDMAAGEAYMEGKLTIESGTLEDFLDICAFALGVLETHPLSVLRRHAGRALIAFKQANRLTGARRNVAHHYDLSDRLYELFLDADRQYSCAYFQNGDETLEEAQHKKQQHIIAKLLLKPGVSVLDIGCGWGGLALAMARAAPGISVVGLTLSENQLRIARERAQAAGLADRVSFELRDYREETGSYDRIVSVGMFEHVGVPNYRKFFEVIAARLKPDGVALVHAIGVSATPTQANPWVGKYIFPGGYCPPLSEVLPVVEKSPVWVTDIEIWRQHYAKTLQEWSRRFRANRKEVAALYDERFCRMWEFYLAGAEANFRHGPMMVFQMQLAHPHANVPITRNYMTDP